MNSIVKSAGIVALSTFISRVMGFIRDMLMAAFFGATGLTDAFFLAFKIPNLLRRYVAEGTLTISFVPVYTEYLIKEGREKANELAQKTLSLQMLIISILIFLGIVFSPQIVAVIGYGFKSGEILDLAINLNRIMFPYLFFTGFVAFAMGILNSNNHFFAPSFSPVMFNLGIITGIVFFSRFFSQPLYGVAMGVIFGGILQFILQIPFIIKTGFRLRISFDINHPGIRKIFKLFGPSVFSNGLGQIMIMISTIYASMLPSGSISYLYYSDRLTEIVLGVFIISIGNVILPEMSKMNAVNDYKGLSELYTKSVRSALFLAMPATIALAVIGFPIISVLFMRNEFSVIDAQMTYSALFFASLGMSSTAIIRVTIPTFFSMNDSRKPVFSSLFALIVFVISGYFLKETELRHAGLTLAYSLSFTIQMVILIFFLQKKIGNIPFKSIIISVLKFLIGCIFMALVIHLLSGYVDWVNDRFIKKIIMLFVIIISGVFVYFAVCILLKVDEAKYLLNRMKERFINSK